MNLLAIKLCNINSRKRKRQINPCKCHPVCRSARPTVADTDVWLFITYNQSPRRCPEISVAKPKAKERQQTGNSLKKCPTTATHVIPLWWVMFVTEAQLCFFFWAGVASCGSSQRRCYNELAKALCMQSMQHAMCLIHHLYLLTCLLFAQESNQTCWYVCPHSLCLAEVWTLTVQGYSAVQHSPAHR